jgi:Flp pilus assembly protein TadG
MFRNGIAQNASVGRQCRPRGTAALEFVLVLPVLVLMLVGATDISRALHVRNVLSNAARCGAMYGATHQVTDYIAADWESCITACAAEEAASLPHFDPDLLQVDVSTFDDPDGSLRVQVSVSYSFELLFDWPGWPAAVLLEHQVSMRSFR